MFPHLLWAHVEFGADLARVASEERRWCKGAWLIFILLLVHRRHQTKVSHFHYVVHSEEDVGGLREQRLQVTLCVPNMEHKEWHQHGFFFF